MFEELNTVILTHDIEAHSLRKGDMGAIVHVYRRRMAYEVEFVDSSTGRTTALLTLYPEDIRSAKSSIIITKPWEVKANKINSSSEAIGEDFFHQYI